jgi:hypothetical protein
MLHPHTGGPPNTRARYLAGALVALGVAVYLTFAGVAQAVRGCSCAGGLSGDWVWVAMLTLAGVCYAAALALSYRAVRSAR